ncbi:SUMO protease ULP2 [Ascoidea rubescens DSM 1968]|uniref:Cysteine proteinase n=1 Tax=Ascoidea rubescens DSM 1968 TaxID=1344418 RepID=A0A1D2VB17_9ASCO|nr:cysteine proteinase [Ascoidea rubescens DSM 1968]ODV58790.1 cysteine proteinase [Ascoidea rubescens DSM 1968]
MPINESLHWYCTLIAQLPRLLKGGEANIYVFDSLKHDHENITEPIKSFLSQYAEFELKKSIDLKKIKMRVGWVPKQNNFNDCGVHVIYNVTKFLENHTRCIKIWNSGKNEISVKKKFFDNKERSLMREKLRYILLELRDNQNNPSAGESPSILNPNQYTDSETDNDVEILDFDQVEKKDLPDNKTKFNVDTDLVDDTLKEEFKQNDDYSDNIENKESQVDDSFHSSGENKIFNNDNSKLFKSLYHGSSISSDVSDVNNDEVDNSSQKNSNQNLDENSEVSEDYVHFLGVKSLPIAKVENENEKIISINELKKIKDFPAFENSSFISAQNHQNNTVEQLNTKLSIHSNTDESYYIDIDLGNEADDVHKKLEIYENKSNEITE